MDTSSRQFVADREEELEVKPSLRLETDLQWNGRRRALNLTVVKGSPNDGDNISSNRQSGELRVQSTRFETARNGNCSIPPFPRLLSTGHSTSGKYR
jgi:hypothetical protein